MGALAFTPGDKVKLTDRFALTLQKLQRDKDPRVNWPTRRGVVAYCNKTEVAIVWGGRTSREWLPIKAVERVVL